MASSASEPGEELALEIDAQAKGHHRDAEPVGDAGELPDLILGEELRFVDEDAIDLAAEGFLADAIEEIVAGVEEIGFGRDADARARCGRRCRCRWHRGRRCRSAYACRARGSCTRPAAARSTCRRSWSNRRNRAWPSAPSGKRRPSCPSGGRGTRLGVGGQQKTAAGRGRPSEPMGFGADCLLAQQSDDGERRRGWHRCPDGWGDPDESDARGPR